MWLYEMRVVINQQMQIGEIDISKIRFNPKSRDDIPQVLMGLQYIYVNISVREEIFSLLTKSFSPKKIKIMVGQEWEFGLFL